MGGEVTWVVLLTFVRLTTSRRVFKRPFSVGEVLDVVDGWLAQPSGTVIGPTDRHPAVVRELLAPVGAAGHLATDAHLAGWPSSSGPSCPRPIATSPASVASSG